MSDSKVTAAAVADDESNHPGSGRKLKQACLPFKLLVNSPGTAGVKCRKRKLSGSENDETRVANAQVEPVNGGAKRFIMSDGQGPDGDDAQTEITNEDEVGVEEPVRIVLSENSNEKTEKEINDLDTSKVNDDDIMDIDDNASVSSDSNHAPNNTSVTSASDNGKVENITPTAKKLTPTRLLKKKQESAKKQEERLKRKQEKERAKEEKQQLKQLEKEQKKNAEMEAKRLRELEKEKEKKQKENEKKAKELEKERERKQKELEKKAKELEREKEKKQKEEEKKAKELEKEKQKEEKFLREEMEKKKSEKVKAAFVGFFKPKNLNTDVSKDEEKINSEHDNYFMPFQTKQDMKIAPFCRAFLNSDRKQIVDVCISQYEKNKDLLYLNLLKAGKHKPSKSEATWPVQIEDNTDVIIIETGSMDEDVNEIGSSLKNNSQKCRWKLLQFHENKRPPYFGTWRKKSLFVKPRRPFACDEIMFDYEIDSDDEWEEEDPGESIHGTDDEVEPEDEYEVDNDVFVPHGYLSDEEGEGQHNDNVSKEVQKEKLKLLGEEFEAEIKKKTERIKPRLVGCIWIPNNVTNPENMSKSVTDTLLKYRCIWDNEEPIITETPISEESPKDVTASENKKTVLLPDSIIPDLIKFVHGNTNGIKVTAKNFFDTLVKNGQNDGSINSSCVMRTIKTIATKSSYLAPWIVDKVNFEKYGVEYPKVVENDVPKSTKLSVKKITSFMTPQSHQSMKTTLLEKSSSETVDKNVSKIGKSEFAPKNLFDINENPKLPVKEVVIKEEQKVNIVGGKKRITPILLSPKKKLKVISDKTFKEKSPSPGIEIICQETRISNDKTV